MRLLHWMIASVVYAGALLLLVVGVAQGWMDVPRLMTLAGFVAAVIVTGYIALRSGWSERFRDPSLTMWQLSMGVVAVNWGYVICGPMRSSALFPLMVIFAFGAFSLGWRRILMLTLLALGCLAAAIVARYRFPDFTHPDAVSNPLQLDLNNFMMIVVVLPALAVIAAQLSALRAKLRDQRAALSAALGEVQRLATCDELTGVPNRRSMVEAMATAASLAEHGGPRFCVALLDIDRFKQVNDELGHNRGDELLRNFAQAALSSMRGTDRLGRWGGEEFLVVLPGLELEGARKVVERLRVGLRNAGLPGRPVTFSAGVALWRAGEDPSATVARADDAMYAAKRAGRDAVCAESDMVSDAGVTRADAAHRHGSGA